MVTWEEQQMATANDIAVAWEKERNRTENLLNGAVERNPNFLGVLIATSIKTSIDLGAGFVDVLRLGTGAAEGGLGWAEDGLRVVGLVGPLGRGAKLVRSSQGARAARLIADPGGLICSWVNSTKALRHVGQKFFAEVDDLARAVLGSNPQIGGIPLSRMSNHLGSIGVAIGQVKKVTTVSQIKRMLPRDGSVVLISLRGVKNGKAAGGHAIYAFYDKLGRLRFSDRSGIYKRIDEIAARYSKDEYIPRGAVHMKNLFMKFIGPKGTGTLAIAINSVIAPNDELVHEITESGQNSGKRSIKLPPQYAGKMPPVEYLTGVRARLMNLGYYDGEISGPYDGKSRAAVIVFQKAHPPLAPDGIPGPKTQARLKQEHGS